MDNNSLKKIRQQRYESWMVLLVFLLPVLVVYMIYLMAINDHQEVQFTLEHYGNLWIAFSIAYLLMACYKLYKKQILDRITLAVGIFVIGAAITYLADLSFVAHYYNNYPYILFFFYLIVIGIITTFFTEAGFIGIDYPDKKLVRKESLYLLMWVIIYSIGIFITHYYLPIDSHAYWVVWMMILMMRVAYDHCLEKIEKKEGLGKENIFKNLFTSWRK